jgi:hypothetical protein
MALRQDPLQYCLIHGMCHVGSSAGTLTISKATQHSRALHRSVTAAYSLCCSTVGALHSVH